MQSFRRSSLKRCFGILIGMAPIALAVASLLSDAKSVAPAQALGMSGIFALLAALNLWLSFGRPGLWKLRHGTLDGYRHASGVPVLSTIFGILACCLGFGAAVPSAAVLLALMADTGGLPWLVVATWHDESMWGIEVGSDDRSA